MNETREEFYTRSLKEHGYICPANEFDLPNFSQVTFADTCNADWCPYFKSVCLHFGGKGKSVSHRRKLAVELREYECQPELFGEEELCLCQRSQRMKTWRILYETGDEAYVVKETLEEAIVYAREQGAFPFFLVMEISEVKEQAGEVERFSPDKLPPPPWNLSVGEFHVSEVWR